MANTPGTVINPSGVQYITYPNNPELNMVGYGFKVQPNQTYLVQYSTDLVNWTDGQTITVNQPSFQVTVGVSYNYKVQLVQQ